MTRVQGRAPTWAAPALVFALTCAVYGWGAAQRDLWRTDEHRYAEIARVLALPGSSWAVLHLNGDPYASKPPLYYWCAAALHGGLGLPLPLAAMLPSVLSGALAVALTFDLGRRAYGVAGGLAAAAVLASSEMFVNLAIRADLDALLTAATTGALYAYWRGEEARARGDAALRFDLLAGAAAAAGILTKGPVGAAVPLAVVASHRWLRAGIAGLGGRGLWKAAGVALLPVLLWLAAAGAEAGWGFVRTLTLGEGLGHALGQHGKHRPLWYYLADFPGGFVPWVVLLPAALLAWRRASRSSGGDLALAWLVAPLLAFSLLPAKRHNYLLPLYPGAALLLGGLFAKVSARGRAVLEGRGVEAGWLVGTALLGLAAAVLGVALVAGGAATLLGWDGVLAYLLPHEGEVARGETLPAVTALLSGPVLIVAGLQMAAPDRTRPAWAAAVLAAGVALFLAGVFHPLESAGRSPREFYAEVERVVGDQPLTSYGGMDYGANWMTGRTVVKNLRSLGRVERFAQRWPELWMVAEERDVEQLGLPEGGEVVVRHPRPLAPTLVLIRVGDAPSLAFGRAAGGRTDEAP